MAGRAVALVASPLGGMGGLAGYHTSVLVGGEEFSFSDAGISVTRGPESHRAPGLQGFQSFELGSSRRSGRELLAALRPHFEPGSYDLLRKNCNTFSDCALFYLLGVRLDGKYCSLERLGQSAGGLLQAVSQGQYRPNPRAEGFDLRAVLLSVGGGSAGAVPGQVAAGGARAELGANELRAARLARLARLGGGGVAAGAVAAPAEAAAAASEQARRDESMARELQASEQSPSARQPASGGAAGVPPVSLLGGLAVGVSQMFGDILSELSQLQSHPAAPLAAPRAAPTGGPAQPEAGLAPAGAGGGAGPVPSAPPADGRRGPRPSVSAVPNPFEGLVRGVQGMFSEIASEVTQLQRPSRPPGQPSERSRDQRLRPPTFGERRHPAPQPVPSAPPPLAGDEPSAPTRHTSAPASSQADPQWLSELQDFAQLAVANVGPSLEEFERQLEAVVEAGLGAAAGAAGGGGGRGGLLPADVEARTVVIECSGCPGRGHEAQEAEQCSVCLDGFSQGQRLRVLPCFHKFHQPCIDRWLASSRECPVCKLDIMRPPQA